MPTPQSIFEGLAKDQTSQEIRDAFGSAGSSPPSVAGTGAIGWLRGIFERLGSGLSVSGPLTDAQLRQNPVPVSMSGAATEATLAQVRDAIKAQIDIASTVWTDDSGAYYVRRDLVNEGTGAISVSFTLPDGSAATPGAGLRPLADADRDITQALFDATAGGAGYSANDILARLLIVDAQVSPPSVVALWANLTTGATIASPTPGTYARADEGITVNNPSLANLDADMGAPADAAATDDFGSWSIFALFKRATSALSTLIARIPEISDEAPLPVRLMDSLDGYSPTLPVSGRAPNGANVPFAVNQNGGTLPADAPALITGKASALNEVLMVIDTTGYQSISLHLFGTWSATVQIQGSNTGQDWQMINAITSNGVAQVSYFNMYSNGTAWIPAVTKYVRFVNSAYASGVVLGAAQLRSSGVQNTQQMQPVNISNIAGTAVVQGGVNGVQAFGGPVAAGVAPGAHNPVQIGGWDGVLLRRLLTDTSGRAIVRGLSDANAPDGFVLTRNSLGTTAELGTQEALGEILRELRVMTMLIKELPCYMNLGSPIVEELDSLRNDVSQQTILN